MNFQPGPVGKFDHTFEKLCPRSRVFRTIIKRDRQSPDLGELVLDAGPPSPQAVAPEVARFVMAEDQRQSTGQKNQHTQRDQLLFRGRIVIPTFDHFAVTVGPRFSPLMRIHPS